MIIRRNAAALYCAQHRLHSSCKHESSIAARCRHYSHRSPNGGLARAATSTRPRGGFFISASGIVINPHEVLVNPGAVTPSVATLYLVCGKPAAGKSTLCQRLAMRPMTVMINEDRWLSALFADQLATVPDYIERSARLRGVMGEHVITLLRTGVSVVLDFPANTPNLRRWMRSLFESAGAEHELHFLDVPDAVCKQRLQNRNAEGSHVFAPTDEHYDQVVRYFLAPSPDEGFKVTQVIVTR
jgi:predicted kinase